MNRVDIIGTCAGEGGDRFSRVWARYCQVHCLLDTGPRNRHEFKTYQSSSGPSLRFC